MRFAVKTKSHEATLGVKKQLKALDPKCTFSPESNPVIFWVESRSLHTLSIMKLEGVEDAIVSSDQVRTKYSEGVMRDIREHRGLDATDTSQDHEIARLPREDALAAYLEWNGIHGFNGAILNIVEATDGE